MSNERYFKLNTKAEVDWFIKEFNLILTNKEYKQLQKVALKEHKVIKHEDEIEPDTYWWCTIGNYEHALKTHALEYAPRSVNDAQEESSSHQPDYYNTPNGDDLNSLIKKGLLDKEKHVPVAIFKYQALKYILREGFKHPDSVEDIDKAIDYLKDLRDYRLKKLDK